MREMSEGRLDPKLNLDLGEVRVGMLLQAIEDTSRIHFASREYGILVQPANNLAGVVQLWKAGQHVVGSAYSAVSYPDRRCVDS